MIFSFDDVMHACGPMDGPPPLRPGFSVTGVSIDSRTTRPGDLFVCLHGDNHDGHDFIGAAIEKGATAVIAQRGRALPAIPSSTPAFLVSDTLVALQGLGARARDNISGLVIGVTGSNGKTSAKEMLLGILSHIYGKDWIYATEGNLNNHIGLPLSLCRATGKEKAVILEMGMNHAREISFLSRIARPQGALITSISGAHLEFFRDVDEIAEVKLEIADGLPDGGVLAYPRSAPRQELAASRARERQCRFISFGLDPSQLIVSAEGIRFPFHGSTVSNPSYLSGAMASNLNGALELLSGLGFETSALVEAAGAARPLTGRRFQVLRKNDAPSHLLIDDSYNANPDSFIHAIESVRRLLPQGRLVLFAGEMAELGHGAADGHRAVGEAAGRAGFECVVAAGTSLADILIEGFIKIAPGRRVIRARDAVEIVGIVDKEPGLMECDGILVKGSRSARMDIVSDAIGKRGYV